MDSETTKQKVTECIDPKDDFIRVRNVRRIRNGGVLVETSDKEGATKIKENTKLKESGLTATSLRQNNRKVMIYDVPSEEFSTVCEAKWKQNPRNRVQASELREGFKLIKEIRGRRGGEALGGRVHP